MDHQFFPTPPGLAIKMWSKFKNRDFRRVLEGSAGEGDLAQAGVQSSRLSMRRDVTIDCIEIDVSKHPILREKGFNVVGLDFLQFTNGSVYSHIILNPSFKDGVNHALRAWDLLWDGEIVVLLNSQTIKNPFSQERQFLVSLIEQHGSVEFIQNAFKGDDVRREADVEVALVYLRKEADTKTDIIGNLFEELKQDGQTDKGLSAGFNEDLLPSLPNTAIENLVLTFNAAVRAAREAAFAQAKSNYYTAMMGETLAIRNGEGGSTRKDGSVGYVQERLVKEYNELKDRAWASILRSTNVTDHLSSAAQRRLESEFSDIKKLDFTVANIHAFLYGLISSKGAIFEDMCCDVFDSFSRYHSDNAVFYKGYRSNDRHRKAGMRLRTTRFILPGHSTQSYSSSLPWESLRMLGDFDKVFAMLDSRKTPEVSLVDVFNNHFNDLRCGARISSSYFDVRYFAGAGTLHLFARSATLVDRLNRMVGKRRKWLPPENERVSDAFWLQYDKAEKFDKSVREEVKKRSQGKREFGWQGPLSYAFSDHERHGEVEKATLAQEILDEAVMAVLEQNGISTDFRLTNDTPPRQPLLLEAA
jgi:hypothetical protein